jgi:DNA-binding SARP family transcriptional activator/WD40 repeat protein
MPVELLGPLLIDGRRAELGRREQVVLSALAVRLGEDVAPDRLAEALWPGDPPPTWPKVVQGCISRLRRTLGAGAIETSDVGYRLTVPADDIDARRFEGLIERGTVLLATNEVDRAAVTLDRALALWRGVPLDVLDGWPAGRIEAARLQELRTTAEELRLDALLQNGNHREVVADAEALVGEQPLREHRWAILATALYRCGRQAEALRALRQCRATLVEQLGIEPGPEVVALEAAILRQDEALGAVPVPLPAIADTCPYQGLAPYDVDDEERYFGRSGDIAACLNRLTGTPLIVITGPSGCGKSSLVRAGLVPALHRLGQRCAVIVPGRDPDAAMTHALSSVTDPAVLVVDQFEEVFLAGDEDLARQRAFCSRLVAYASLRTPVVVAVRGDHLAALAAHTELARLAEQGLHLVTPLAGDALREAIEAPAAQAGLRLESGLVDVLVRDCEGEPGALPLLSHALVETWQRRDGRVLTVEGYRATGEIRGAVARSADRLYDSLPAEQRHRLRALLLRLVAPSTDGPPVRARVPIAAIAGDVDRQRLLGLLVRSRLVITQERSIELAHEALTHAWPRLRAWLDEDAAGQRILHHLAATADGWESLGRPASELYRGGRLETVLEWRAESAPDLTVREQQFLDESQAAEASEHELAAQQGRRQARQNRRLRQALVAAAVLLALAVVGGAVAVQQRGVAQREERATALTALTSNAVALRTNRRDLAALLSVEANRLAPSPTTDSALFGTFTAAPGLTRMVHTDIDLAQPRAHQAFVPGTDEVATVDARGAVHVLDLVTGTTRQFAALGDEEGVTNLAVATGRDVAAVLWHREVPFGQHADETFVTVWDVGTGERNFDPIALPYAGGAIALSADGSLIAIGGDSGGTTDVFDATTGELLVEIPQHVAIDGTEFDQPPTFTLAFTPDGSLLIGTEFAPIRVVDPRTGVDLRVIGAPQFTADVDLFVSDDGTELFTVGSGIPNELSISTSPLIAGFDLVTGEPLWPEHRVPDHCVRVAYSGLLGALLCGGWSGEVVAVDVSTGAPVRAFDAQQGDVCGLAVSTDGTRLVQLASCANGQMTAIEWRLDGGGPVSRVFPFEEADQHLLHYGFAGDDGALVVDWKIEDFDVTTSAIDSATGEIIRALPDVLGIVPTRDPDVVVFVGDHGRSIGRYNVATDEPVGSPVELPFFAHGMWATDDLVVVANWNEQGSETTYLQGFDPATGELVAPRLEAENWNISDIAFADDVMYVETFANEFWLERRDVHTGELVGEPVAGLTHLTTGGGILVAVTTDGHILQVDPDSLAPLGAPFPGVTGPARDVALDRDGRLLMVRGEDNSIRIYDVASRTQLGDPIDLDHPGPLSRLDHPWAAVPFSDCGSEGCRGTFFRPRTGLGAAVRADGGEVAATFGPGIVVWDLNRDRWFDAACQVAGRNLTREEWDRYIGDLAPYRATCPDHPVASA